jgi:hypothetical protein
MNTKERIKKQKAGTANWTKQAFKVMTQQELT